MLTGRLPYRLSAVQKNLIPWDMPVGTNLSYTMLPKKLKAANYESHHIGKWHQGFFTDQYTPEGRGFDSSFGFLVGGITRGTHTTHATHASMFSLCAREKRETARERGGGRERERRRQRYTSAVRCGAVRCGAVRCGAVRACVRACAWW